VSNPQVSQTVKEQAVLSYNSGESSAISIAKVLGVTRETVHRWTREYKRHGDLSRRVNPLTGQQPKLNERNASSVLGILDKPASEYGYETDFWTTLRLQQIIKKELKISISRMSISRTLRKFEYSYRKPEVIYYNKNKDKQMSEWRKKTVPEINKIIKDKRAILYFEDESNISMTATVAKTWGKKGESLTRDISPHRGSVSAISAISNSGQLLFNIHDHHKRFKSQDIISFLTQMLKHHKRRHLIVVMDQAPCHTSKMVKAFIESQVRLHVFYLPPCSPELNPDEKVWNHLKNKELLDHQAKTTKDLKKLAKYKLRKISKNKSILKGIYLMCQQNVFSWH